MKTFIINNNDAGQRLDKFLLKALPNIPKSVFYKGIRTKNIKINRKRAEISTMLNAGDVVDLYIKEVNDERPENLAFLAADKEIDIVYEDENIILANKPQGLVVHEDESNSPDTLINRILCYLYKKKEYDPALESSFVPALCNRIDRNTCGIVICAKNAAALRVLNDKIKNREVIKKYRALALGTFQKKHEICKAFLMKDSNKKQVTVFDSPRPGALTIITEYDVLKQMPKGALLDVTLHTGRTHQIRAHLAHLGHPLAGDTKYGTFKDNEGIDIKHQALCAYSLTFDFKTDADILNYLNGKTFTTDKIPFTADILK